MTGRSQVACAYQEWQKVMTACTVPAEGTGGAALDALAKDLYRRADAIVTLPSRNPSDLLLKLAAHTDFFKHDLGNCPGRDALIEELRRTVQALCDGDPVDEVAHSEPFDLRG